jgi:two-component system, chemotaxis family, sensor kinase Cph1
MSNLSLPLGPGGHACLLYDTFDEQRDIVVPFIKEGLENDEQCVYVADEQSAEDWCFEFETQGIDVDKEKERGSLIVCSGEHWRRPTGFSSTQNGRDTWRTIERALAGFCGIRFAVDLGWTLDPPVPNDLVCHWEATLNVTIDDAPARVLCLYNLRRHTATAVHSALRTHPIAVVAGAWRGNPFYEAPSILQHEPHLNHSKADATMVEGMLMSLAQHPQVSK